ncbi:hypothetical protein [Acerihabitans sp.]|uniref:hypothetical protein n=1 Tax=Acerihabitans sp. TaxID=2811394 RepID=UPI002ED8C409
MITKRQECPRFNFWREILPAQEPRFALKGGTAINLFEHCLPAWEMLAPGVPLNFAATFDVHFKGMTAGPVSAEQLLESRKRLLTRVAGWMSRRAPDRQRCIAMAGICIA